MQSEPKPSGAQVPSPHQPAFTPDSLVPGEHPTALSVRQDADRFLREFRALILVAWSLPPVFGLGFIIYIRVLTPHQVLAILATPVQQIFIFGWMLVALVLLSRSVSPVVKYLRAPEPHSAAPALRSMQRFPLAFWSFFLSYLLLAPGTVILTAEAHSDFVARPIDWFRIHLVAVIVSIIVGLPIFFALLDLFGRSLDGLRIRKAHVTLKAKVFLIGAMIPLLIDTMLVQYFWTRTGYFTIETFFIWLVLELLAVAGSLLFLRSIAQSLHPLQDVISAEHHSFDIPDLRPQSTDELGVISSGYRDLLRELRIRNDVLELRNRVLRETGIGTTLGRTLEAVAALGREAVCADTLAICLRTPDSSDLAAVAVSGRKFQLAGHFRVSQDRSALIRAVMRERAPRFLNATATGPATDMEVCKHLQCRTLRAVPLVVDDEVIGVLLAGNQTPVADAEQNRLPLLEALAHETALALHGHRIEEQRNAAEAARAERDSLVRLLLDSTAEGIYGVDLEGNCIFVNRACVEMLGYQGENDLLDKNMHALAHHTRPDGSSYPKSECRVRLSTLAGRSSHCDEEVQWRADGSSFPVEYWSHPIRRDGDIIGSVVTLVDITERRRTQEALKRSEERYALAQKAANIGSWEWIIERDQVYWSDTVAPMFGLKPGEFGGTYEGYLQRVHPDDQSRVSAAVDRVIRDQSDFEIEHRVIWPDGSIRWLSASGRLYGSAIDNTRRLLGIVRDITEERAAEDALRRSRAQLAEAQRIAKLGSWDLDLRSGEATWSDEEYRLLGYADERVPSTVESFIEAVHEGDRKRVLSAMHAATQDPTGEYEVEHRVLGSDGVERIVWERGRVIFDAQGEPARMLGTTLDITEIRQAQRSMTEAQERLRSVIACAPIILFGLDTHGVFTVSEGYGSRALGLEAGEVVGQSVFEVHAAVPEMLTQVRRALSGERFVAHARIGERYYEVSYSPILDDSGSPAGTIAVAIDDTDRYVAEQELTQHRARLEELVDERTRELRSVNKELEAFSYSVSHDLRAPLRTIDGFSQALLEDFAAQLDAEGQDYLHRIRSAARRMAELIDDLLELSRVTRQPLRAEDVDLTSIANEIIQELRQRTPQRQVAVQIAPHLVAHGDRGLLRALLENLLGNAWKFTKKKALAEIIFKRVETAGPAVRFVIGDNGAGFEMRHADKLFGAFQRLHREAEFEGTGIGLATVQRIVNRHGGNIWAEARPGEGARFYFELPAKTSSVKNAVHRERLSV